MKKSILHRLAGIVAAAALAGGLLVAPLGGLSMSQAAPADSTCTAVGSSRTVYTAVPGTYWVRETVVRDTTCGDSVVQSQTVVNYSNPWVHGSTVVTVDRNGGRPSGSVVTQYPCWNGGRLTMCETTVTW